MKKLSLDLNELRVDTFQTLDHTLAGPRGTVRANQAGDTVRGDTMLADTMVVDTMVVDTMVVDTMLADTMRGDTLQGVDTMAIGDTVP